MASIFPSNPSNNDEFEGYRFNGVAWKIIGVNLTADYPEVTDGYISEDVIPVTIARVDDVNQSLENFSGGAASGDILKAQLFFGGTN